MKKRLLSLLLCLSMAASLLAGLSLPAAATETPTLTVENVTGRAGATVDVKINLTDNPGIACMRFGVAYDAALTLTAVTAGDALTGLTFTQPGNFAANPVYLTWDGLSNATANGTVATLTFAIADGAEEGDYPVTLSYRSGDIINAAAEDVAVTLVNGAVTVRNVMVGDINDDTVINMRDILVLRQYLAGGYGVTIVEAAADVNNDNAVNMRDVLILRQYLAGGYGVDELPYPPPGEHTHTLTHHAAVAATETTEGNIEYWTCSGCGEYFSDAAGTNKITRESTVIPPIAAVTYRIDYDLTGDGDPYLKKQTIENTNPTYVVAGGSVELENPSVPGYTFLGWYDLPDGDAATNYKTLTNVSKNWKLYAHWKKVTYSIDYDLSLVPDAQLDFTKYATSYTVDQNKPVYPLDVNNYIFLGWFDDDGNQWESIPVGTVGNLTLHARYTSQRNLAKPIAGGPQLDYFVEDQNGGVYYFAYELGTIENVPLTNTANWTIQNVAGLSQQVSQSYSTTITEGYAQTISDTISNTTVDSSTWTLSDEWNSTTTANEEWAQERNMTVEQATERATSYSGTLSLVSETGGSEATTKKTGTETLKYDTKEKTTGHEFGAKLDVGAKAGLSDVPVLIGGVVPAKGSAEVSANLGLSYNYKNETKKKTGTETTTFDTTVTENTSHWNDTVSMSETMGASEKESYRQAMSEMIGYKQNYGQSYSAGGSESSTLGRSSTESASTTSGSTVNYSKVTQTGTTRTYSVDGRIEGKYRSITAGTFHVFAVVGYDIGTRSYFTNTFSVMDDETYEFLDYTPKGGSFNDCEYTILPFEVPHDIYDHIAAHTSMTRGVQYVTNSLNGTATITGYTGTCTDVLIPDYISDGNRAYRVTAISAGAFAGKTALRAVILNQFIDEIPDDAFNGCSSLEAVSGVFTKIGNRAFSGCGSLSDFTVHSGITSIGTDAFVGVPSLTVTTGSAAVADAAVQSGALQLTLDISEVTDAANLTLNAPATMTRFALQGGRKTYANLKLTSAAAETAISCLTVTGSAGIPLEISSNRLTLEEANFSAPAFVLKLTNPGNVNITLVRDSYLTSSGSKAVLVKVPTVASSGGATGTLTVTGDMFVLEGNREFAGKNLVSFASGEVKELTAELFAKYLEGLSTLTLDPGEGALPAGDPGTRTIYYGEAIGTLPTPTRDYYDFDGWYTAASGGTKVTSSSTFTGDVTLYAHWTIHIPSDWVLASQVPSGAQVVERKYSYTKRDYTESSSSSISGWTWYDTRRTGWGSWSDWLTWDPTNGERNVESRSVYDHTNYHYYRWTSPSHNAIYTYETSDYNCHTLEEDWFTYELPVSSRGYPVVYNGTDNWANRWVPANYAGNYSVDKTFTQDVYRTEWRYQDPVYTYYFYKDSNLESPSYPSGSDISNIQEWVRYRAK